MAQSLEAKIVVLGSQGVGKTSLVHRFVKNQFSPASTTSTVGASFLTKRVVDSESDSVSSSFSPLSPQTLPFQHSIKLIPAPQVVRLQIWDTAGQERFRSISRLYYRGANACILCYSITDQTSFEEMGVWLTELRRNLPSDIILHVVGTKADLVGREPHTREVPFERCIAYVAENLAPGLSGTPPATATPGGVAGNEGYRLFAGQTATAGGLDGAKSPSSKRSSGFWGQEVGWDCCHEVSAENGEGVEEVFRVITRKLVEQNRKIQEQLSSAVQTPGAGTPGLEGGESGYFDGMRPGGSFRVGRDRRSWFGVPTEIIVDQHGPNGEGGQQVKVRRKCC